MILDNRELEFLKLCGIARYLPCGIISKYDIPSIGQKTVNTMLKFGYIKVVNGTCKCYRLMRKGKDILIRAGYDFADDARAHKKGSIFDRRVINAELNTLLYGSGINIYAGTVEGLGDAEYISCIILAKNILQVICLGRLFTLLEHQQNESFSSSLHGRTTSLFSAEFTRICTKFICGSLFTQAAFT